MTGENLALRAVILPMSKQEMSGNDACIAMHAALRKCCDSPQTSALYNIVHVIQVRPRYCPWRLFGSLVAAGLADRKGPIPPMDVVKDSVGKLEDAWLEIVRQDDRALVPDDARPALYAILSIMKLMTEDDWGGMASFL